MLPADEAIPLASFIKSIAFTLNQYRLYSENHPIVRESLSRLGQQIQAAFESRDKLILGHMRETLVIDGKLITKKDPACLELAKAFLRVNIEAVVFHKGITFEEFSEFIKLLGMRPKDLEAKGGFASTFNARKFQKIQLSTGKFQLVEDGQAVLDDASTTSGDKSSSGGRGDAPVVEETIAIEVETPKRPASIFEVIQGIRASHQGSGEILPEVQLDCEKIIYQLEKQPQEVAQAAIENVQDPQQIEPIIRNIAKQLTEGLVSFLVDNTKDITKALERFAKEIEKAIQKTLGDKGSEGIKDKITRVFQDSIDQHRIQMALKTFEKNRSDPKPVQKMILKLFQKEDVRERLLPSLRDKMITAGFNEQVFDEIFEEADEKAAKKKSKVSIDAKELAELKKKAELFDKAGLANAVEQIEKLKVEKKRALDEKERVDAVIRNLAEGLVVVDKEGKVVLMNPAAEKLLGIRQSEKQGKDISEGLQPEHLLAMTQGNLASHEGDLAKQVALQSLNEETRRVLQASTAVVENQNGQTVGMVAVLSDVTKQKEIENLKSQFVANVSHELRTPLVAIQKSLGLILGKEVGEVNPEQERFLTMAHRNIDRLSRLINDLLDVSKLEARKMTLQPVLISVNGLVQMVLSTMETWFKDKRVNVSTQFSKPQIEIEADPDRLTQVVTNLVGNAIKYTPEGGSITIEVNDPANHSKILASDCIEVRVRDTGIGIAPEDQRKIFDKFVQVSLAQPAGVSSTGLGLTIAKEIVELHSGGIFLESEVGKGSCFYFQLPKRFSVKEDIRSRL